MIIDKSQPNSDETDKKDLPALASEDTLKSGLLIRKKTTRLCIAVYRITELLEPEEVLRLTLRGKVIALLPLAVSFTKPSLTNPGVVIKDITDIVNSILALVDVLVMSDLVSYDNGAIVRDEFVSLMKMIEQYLVFKFGYVVELRSHLDSLEPMIGGELLAIPSPELGSLLKERGNLEGPAPKAKSESFTQSDRRARILDFISKNEASSIRDI